MNDETQRLLRQHGERLQRPARVFRAVTGVGIALLVVGLPLVVVGLLVAVFGPLGVGVVLAAPGLLLTVVGWRLFTVMT